MIEDTAEIDLSIFKHLYAILHKQPKGNGQNTRLVETSLDESMPEFESEFDKLFIGVGNGNHMDNDDPYGLTGLRRNTIEDLLSSEWNPGAERNRQEAEAVTHRPLRRSNYAAPLGGGDSSGYFFCCQCKDGPHNAILNPMCTCHHVRCLMCVY